MAIEKLIKEIKAMMFRVPAEYCKDLDMVRTYLAGRIDERKEIIKEISGGQYD